MERLPPLVTHTKLQRQNTIFVFYAGTMGQNVCVFRALVLTGSATLPNFSTAWLWLQDLDYTNCTIAQANFMPPRTYGCIIVALVRGMATAPASLHKVHCGLELTVYLCEKKYFISESLSFRELERWCSPKQS